MGTTIEKPASTLDSSGAAAVEGLMKVLEALTTQLATLNQRLDRLQTTGLSIAGVPAAEATALAAAPVPAPAVLAAEERRAMARGLHVAGRPRGTGQRNGIRFARKAGERAGTFTRRGGHLRVE